MNQMRLSSSIVMQIVFLGISSCQNYYDSGRNREYLSNDPASGERATFNERSVYQGPDDSALEIDIAPVDYRPMPVEYLSHIHDTRFAFEWSIVFKVYDDATPRNIISGGIN